jgi:predicted RNase H-like HicB family nuclease
MTRTRTFTAIYQQDGEWIVAWAAELPGANTQGRTLEEARENLVEAIQLILAAGQDDVAQAGSVLLREELAVALS